MDKRQLAEMIENGEEMMRMLESQLRWLRRMATEVGVSLAPKEVPPMDAETSAMRDDMDRMRQELMEKAAADRRRIMNQAREATAGARSRTMGAGGFSMAAPGLPPTAGSMPWETPAIPRGKGDDEQ